MKHIKEVLQEKTH